MLHNGEVYNLVGWLHFHGLETCFTVFYR